MLNRALFATVVVAWACSVSTIALAQDDADGRDGSRPAQRVVDVVAPEAADVTLGYQLDLLGGAYAEGGEASALAAAELSLDVERPAHRVTVVAGVEHDPFARRAFNFSDDDTVASPQRMVQRVDTVGGSLRWRTEPGQSDVDVELSAAHAFTELYGDARTSVDLDAAARFGATFTERGGWIEPRLDVGARHYPDYRVADRRIDQVGAGGGIETGWSFGRPVDLSLTWHTLGTIYLDARYDAIDASGAVVRAEASKRYIAHDLEAELVARPTQSLRASLDVSWRQHDSRNYDRVVDGDAPDGSTDARLVRDYYDYGRIGIDAGVSWRPVERLRLGAGTSWWRREFSTYEARDADNVWRGDLRVDHHVGADVDVTYAVARRDTWELSALAEGSWLSRSSNMRRERSFATNYDLTRVFVGVSLEGIALR